MYGVYCVSVVKRITISTRKERRDKKTGNKQGLVALLYARKSKELLIIIQTAVNQEQDAISPRKKKKKKKGLLFK